MNLKRQFAQMLRPMVEQWDPPPEIPPPTVFTQEAMEPDPLYRAALAGVVWAETVYPEPGRGEWRHHQVFARLLKLFPDRPRWQITGAIQRAVEARIDPSA